MLNSPKKSRPLLESPHTLQKAAPVSAGGVAKYFFGATGLAPFWLVLRGAVGGELHVADGPQPKLLSVNRGMRLISSLQSGPFSVSQRRPFCGSKVNPNELRMP